MLVGIISDTHDNIRQIDRAMEFFQSKKVEHVIHAGDIVAPFSAKALAKYEMPMHIVFGNNDGDKKSLKKIFPQISEPPFEFVLDGKKFVLSHDFAEIPDFIAGRSDVLISGHSHAFVNERIDNKLIINPGECGGWLKRKSTVAILETRQMTVEICDLKFSK